MNEHDLILKIFQASSALPRLQPRQRRFPSRAVTHSHAVLFPCFGHVPPKDLISAQFFYQFVLLCMAYSCPFLTVSNLGAEECLRFSCRPANHKIKKNITTPGQLENDLGLTFRPSARTGYQALNFHKHPVLNIEKGFIGRLRINTIVARLSFHCAAHQCRGSRCERFSRAESGRRRLPILRAALTSRTSHHHLATALSAPRKSPVQSCTAIHTTCPNRQFLLSAYRACAHVSAAFSCHASP